MHVKLQNSKLQSRIKVRTFGNEEQRAGREVIEEIAKRGFTYIDDMVEEIQESARKREKMREIPIKSKLKKSYLFQLINPNSS